MEEGRYFESPLLFKPPALETLVVTANRLLKFEFPPSRNPAVYERLLKTHLHTPGLSRRLVEDLPLFLQERLYGALWQHTLPERDALAPWNRLLALLLLAEQLLEFRPDELVRQDIALLGAQTRPGLHSYYFHGQMDRETLLAILSQNGYRSDTTKAAPETQLLSAYLADRALTRPLPWAQLLEALDESAARQYPRLYRLWLVYHALRRKDHNPPSDETLELLAALKTRLQTDWADQARQSGRSRPVRALVLVEGETEKLLLPVFAEAMGVEFHQLGVYVLPSGGKNQMFSLYQKFRPVLNAPIFIVLDRDAAETAETLRQVLRGQDAIYELAEGEFEDTYDLSLILKTMNRYYEPYPKLTIKGYRTRMVSGEDPSTPAAPVGRVQELKLLWKALDLGAFDKTLFAAQLAETLKKGSDSPPPAIEKLINAILEVRRRALAATK